MTSAARRLRWWLRDRSLAWRTPGRSVLRSLSFAKHRLRRFAGGRLPARVVPTPVKDRVDPITHPAILIVPSGEISSRVSNALARQTESSWTLDPVIGESAPFIWCPDEGPDKLEATHLESLLLTAAAADLDFAVGGWAPPLPFRSKAPPRMTRPPNVGGGSLTLLRTPRPDRTTTTIPGRFVPQISIDGDNQPPLLPFHQNGPWQVNPSSGTDSSIRLPVNPVHRVLADLPLVSGKRTVLFLLPFLAVGGAEKLLFDLIGGLGERYRILVATLDPHRAELGQTVDSCRRLTPQVYTLGDWLPREAHMSALRHLVRRWEVETLVSWNGTVDFYDHAAALGREFPQLRLFAQLYNHEGGWIEHLGSRLIARIDGHLAVNSHIAAELKRRGIEESRIHTVHHGVTIPDLPEEDQRRARKSRKRAELGLPADAVVVGTFIRMHPQKRPLDVIEIARRSGHLGLHFLLAGGGPLDAAVDREIERDPPPNLLRLPMQADAMDLYDAIDICLLTSDFEGLPIFLLDGLAREIPCVATAVGEIPLLLADGGGRLIERPGHIAAFVDALKDLSHTETRREEGRHGRAAVADAFGLETFVAAYERILFP